MTIVPLTHSPSSRRSLTVIPAKAGTQGRPGEAMGCRAAVRASPALASRALRFAKGAGQVGMTKRRCVNETIADTFGSWEGCSATQRRTASRAGR